MNRRQILAGFAAACAAPTFAAAAPTRFSVSVTGSGPDIILIPGLGCAAAVWDASVQQLRATHRVHAVQVAGFAGLPAGPNATGPILAPLAAELAAYIASETTGPVGIVGHSMGGLTGVTLAARHPERIDRVLVVDSLPFFGLLNGHGMSVERMRPQATMMRAQMLAMPPEAYGANLALNAAGQALNPRAQRQIASWSQASDRTVFASAMHEVMTTDIRKELYNVRAAVTLMHPKAADSQEAAIQAAVYSAAYTGLADFRAIAVADAAHFIMLDQPQVFAQHLAAWAQG